MRKEPKDDGRSYRSEKNVILREVSEVVTPMRIAHLRLRISSLETIDQWE
jgi:hypothetical protein